MFTIKQARCNNPDCMVDTFNYASCEPPICPACGVCADCGYPEEEHSDDGECPNDTAEEVN